MLRRLRWAYLAGPKILAILGAIGLSGCSDTAGVKGQVAETHQIASAVQTPGSTILPPTTPANCSGASCCPSGFSQVNLTNGNDVYQNFTANRCVLALNGLDQIQSVPATGSAAVVGGVGNDQILIAPADSAYAWGSEGDDQITCGDGGCAILGNTGNDQITSGNGGDWILPGPGRDIVQANAGNDTVEIFSPCELQSGERLDGGLGTDTLVTPYPLAQLQTMGVTVLGFEQIRVQQKSCQSECVTKPNCSNHGSCQDSTTPGSVECNCDPGWIGPNCSDRDPAADVTPVLRCVITEPDGTYRALFGYQNAATSEISAAIGPSNRFLSGSINRGQPASFKPGLHEAIFYVAFNGNPLSWRLGGGIATADRNSTACAIIPGETETNGPIAKLLSEAPSQAPVLSGPLQDASSGSTTVTLPVLFQADVPGDESLLPEHLRGPRAVEVVLVNSSGQPLTYVSGLAEGLVTIQPPHDISSDSYGSLETQNGKPLQGTGGEITYRIGAGTGPTVKLHWNDPFIGSNEYTATLDGSNASQFAVDVVGGSGNRATVFFLLRQASTPSTSCPKGSAQWLVDSLRVSEPPLSLFDMAIGAFTTPAKRITGITKWASTGCAVSNVVGRVKQVGFSTDNFWTIDLDLDEWEGVPMTGTNRAVRIEVDPARGTLTFPIFDPALGVNSAWANIMFIAGFPVVGQRVSVTGDVLIDHGAFLEIHPVTPIQVAPNCATVPTPSYCRGDVITHTWTIQQFVDSQTPLQIGRAPGRACFLTGVSGKLDDPAQELHVSIDPTTGNWIVTGSAPGIPFPGGGKIYSFMTASARCVAVADVDDEIIWHQGEPDKVISSGSSTDCYLTRIGGKFEPTTRLGVHELSGTLLGGSGSSAGAANLAGVRCVEIVGGVTRTPVPPGGWYQGAARISLTPLTGSPCFLTAIGGKFSGDLELVNVLASTIAGTPRWTLGGSSNQTGLFADASCARPIYAD